jgi:hypothetical protein
MQSMVKQAVKESLQELLSGEIKSLKDMCSVKSNFAMYLCHVG